MAGVLSNEPQQQWGTSDYQIKRSTRQKSTYATRRKKAFQPAEEDGLPIFNRETEGIPAGPPELRSLWMADIIGATAINGEDLSRDES